MNGRSKRSGMSVIEMAMALGIVGMLGIAGSQVLLFQLNELERSRLRENKNVQFWQLRTSLQRAWMHRILSGDGDSIILQSDATRLTKLSFPVYFNGVVGRFSLQRNGEGVWMEWMEWTGEDSEKIKKSAFAEIGSIWVTVNGENNTGNPSVDRLLLRVSWNVGHFMEEIALY